MTENFIKKRIGKIEYFFFCKERVLIMRNILCKSHAHSKDQDWSKKIEFNYKISQIRHIQYLHQSD